MAYSEQQRNRYQTLDSMQSEIETVNHAVERFVDYKTNNAFEYDGTDRREIIGLANQLVEKMTAKIEELKESL